MHPTLRESYRSRQALDYTVPVRSGLGFFVIPVSASADSPRRTNGNPEAMLLDSLRVVDLLEFTPYSSERLFA